MRVLVTGASGRVGSAVVQRLLDAGHEITALDAIAPRIDDPRCRIIVGRFEETEPVREACVGADAVVHLGAFMSWHADDADRLFSANVVGTRSLLEAAATAGAKRFVFASSGEVYPENNCRYLPVDEQHPLQPTTPYGLTKQLGEELVQFFDRARGLPSVILRFSHTQNAGELLDPDSFFSGPRFFLRPKVRQQESFGNADTVAALKPHDDGTSKLVLSRNTEGRPFRMMITDTRDMADGVVLALEHPGAPGEVFNLGADHPVDFGDALPVMADAIGLPLVKVDLPGAGVFYETSNSRIRELLGFRPRWQFSDMIEEAAQAWKQRHANPA